MEKTEGTLTLTDAKVVIDRYLRSYTQQRVKSAELIDENYARLHRAIGTLIEIGGKRLRPYMVLLAYSAYCDDWSLNEDVIPAAAAQELLHLAMLVHDDIIDRDYIRYGIPNVAGFYQTFYQTHTDDAEEQHHFATSAALLAGDILLSDAHMLLRKTQRPHALVSQAEDSMSNAIFAVIGGELLDTETSLLPKGTVDPLVIAEYKTSSYSFVGPLTIGAILANAPEADIELLRTFGRHLGIAYQLHDDILGVFGDTHKTGKSTTTDIREGKQTFLINAFDQQATETAKTEFYKLFHNPHATDEQLEGAKKLLIESGARKMVETRIAHHRAECEQIIASLQLSDESKDAFIALLNLCLKRES